MGPSGKLRDKKAHDRSFLLKARVMKVKEAHTYTKERQIMGMTRMIHHMEAPRVAKAPGWALRYRTYRRITKGFNYRGNFAASDTTWQEEKLLDDDPEEFYADTSEREGGSSDDSPHGGDSVCSNLPVVAPLPGCIFASYLPYGSNGDVLGDVLIRDKKDFRRRTKNLLGIGPPNVDNSEGRATPQWLSCLHLRKRAGAHAEVKHLIESWDGEAFEFARTTRMFEADKDLPDSRGQFHECMVITVRPIWIKRTQPEPVFEEDSVRGTRNQSLVL